MIGFLLRSLQKYGSSITGSYYWFKLVSSWEYCLFKQGSTDRVYSYRDPGRITKYVKHSFFDPCLASLLKTHQNDLRGRSLPIEISQLQAPHNGSVSTITVRVFDVLCDEDPYQSNSSCTVPLCMRTKTGRVVRLKHT